MSSFGHLSLARLRRCLPVVLLTMAVSANAADAQPKAVAGEPPQPLTPRILYEFLLGEIAGANGDLGVAVESYTDLARRTRDVRIVKRAAEVALVGHNVGAAREMANLWLELTPGAPEPRRLLSSLHGADDSIDLVQVHLAKALTEAGDKLPQALLGLDQALAGMGDPAGALRVIERITEPYLDRPEAHVARAQAHLRSGDEAGAIPDIDVALTQRPDWDIAVLMKAQVLQHQSPEAARDWLAAYVARHPDSVTAHNAYARTLVGTQQYSAARDEFRKALAITPDDTGLRYAVAVLSLQLKDYDAAEADLMKLLEAGSPDPDTIRSHLAQVALERKDDAGARQWLESVENPQMRVDARIQVAALIAQSQSVDEARAYLQAQTGDAATVRRFHLAEAQLLRDAKRYQETYDYLDGLLQGDYPDDPDMLYESAMMAEKLGHSDVMEGRLRKLIALKPEYAQAYNALGYLLVDRKERLPEAEKLLTRALSLAPEDPYILDSVGWLYFRQGKPAEALDYLRKAYKREADPEIAAHLGEALWVNGQQAEARQTWEAASKAHPDNEALRATMKRLLP